MSLKEIRESKGIKQKAIAEHLGVSRQTYCKYEADPYQMSINQALAVCNFIGCKIDDIFLPEKVN